MAVVEEFVVDLALCFLLLGEIEQVGASGWLERLAKVKLLLL